MGQGYTGRGMYTGQGVHRGRDLHKDRDVHRGRDTWGEGRYIGVGIYTWDVHRSRRYTEAKETKHTHCMKLKHKSKWHSLIQ